MILDASANASFTSGIFGKYHFFILQLIWITLGSVVGYLVYKIDYHILQKYSPLLLIAVISLLVLVLVKGQDINGARRWINLGLFNLQPSELAKITVILYLSAWLSKPILTIKTNFKKRLSNHILPFLFIIGMVTGLIIIGRDLGTGEIILFTSVILFFLGGIDFIHIVETFILGFVITFLTIASTLFQGYRSNRLSTFLNYNANPLTQGYQLQQILITLSQGGFLGKGFTNALQQTLYLVSTTAINDSIFAVIAMEWGFIGCLILFSLFTYIIYRGFRIALKAPDKAGKLLAAGITIWIFIQFFLNIAANIDLIPLTGVPLPFISYGGSAIISVFCGIAILLNISAQIEE